MSLAARASALADDVRERASGLAIALVGGDDTAFHLDSGAHPLTESTRFDIGSVAKTFTALLLADMVQQGELRLDTSIGDLIDAGPNASITLEQLATHTSGLPRLPGNLMAKAQLTPDDPYSDYTADDLLAALHAEAAEPGPDVYSNFGFMVLAVVLGAAGDASFPELVERRVLQPLGLRETGFGFGDAIDRVPGHAGNREVPDWTLQVHGPGGMTSSVADIARYLRVHLDLSGSPLEAAVALSHRPLGWVRDNDVLWHNGGTAGFGAMAAFDRSAQRAVVILVNRAHSPAIDKAALDALKGH